MDVNLKDQNVLLAKEKGSNELRGVEKRKENLEVKIKKLTGQIKNRTDDVVDFKRMGIDHFQFINGIVSAFQIPSPSGTGTAEYRRLRRMGGCFCQKDNRL